MAGMNMKSLVEYATEKAREAGCVLLTLKELDARLAELGYERDPDTRCYGMTRVMSAEPYSYPATTYNVREKGTKISAFHYQDARRDANFIAMQNLRFDTFCVSRSRDYVISL